MEDLKKKLMECAAVRFSQDGYTATMLSDIGRDAGVTRGPLYYYFTDKASLYTETAHFLMEDMKEKYAKILHSGKPIREVIRDEIDFCLSKPPAFFMTSSNAKGAPDLSSVRTEFTEWVIAQKLEIFEKAKVSGELRPDCDISELVSFIYIFYYGTLKVREMSGWASGFNASLLTNSTDFFMQIAEDKFLTPISKAF